MPHREATESRPAVSRDFDPPPEGSPASVPCRAVDPTLVDDVLAGRRLPFSRPFAQAGFGRDESEAWRRAGWTDPAEAARWHHLGAHCTPRQLRGLAREGFTVEDVAGVARWFPSWTAAWVRALAMEAGAFTPADVEIDLRDRVRQNLVRDQPQLRGLATERA